MPLLRRAALLAALALAASCPAALASDPGGATAPAGGVVAPSAGGGARPGEATGQARTKGRRAHRRRRGGPLLTRFELTRPRLFLFGRPARVTFRITGRARTVRVRLYLLRLGRRAPVSTVFLGGRPTGVTQSALLTGRESGVLPQGRYLLKIAARDARGRRLRRAAAASAVTPLSFYHHVFPVAGPHSFGGADARFGAPRSGHTHQGQDVPAAEGTPLVAPRGGTVKAVQYQAGGAGYYVVLHGTGEDRDYVFMHLLAGSTAVREGQTVRTGQRIGEVGATGDAVGAHLHFEVWVGGGWYSGGHPIDPLPLLRAWDSWS